MYQSARSYFKGPCEENHSSCLCSTYTQRRPLEETQPNTCTLSYIMMKFTVPSQYGRPSCRCDVMFKLCSIASPFLFTQNTETPELCMSTARNAAGPTPSAVQTIARSTLLWDTTSVTSDGSLTMSLQALSACSNTRWMGLNPSISNSSGLVLQLSAQHPLHGFQGLAWRLR